jgi:hypothetical protein
MAETTKERPTKGGRFRVVTPSGWLVPGMSGADEAALRGRYEKVMGRSFEQLEREGYRIAWFPNPKATKA